MKKLLIYSISILTTVFIYSCSDDEDTDLEGNWINKWEFDGDQRSSGVSFAIDNFGYVGLGYNGVEDEYYQDFWKYDPDLNYWQEIPEFPGDGRSSAVSFAIGTKGYVGLGFDGNDDLKDFWEYDSETQEWTQLEDFAGTARRSAVAFAIDGKGYVGTGYDGSELKDFWQFNPSTGEWIQIPSMGGAKRRDAVTFNLNGYAFIGTGTNNGSYLFDFWAFDPLLQEAGEFPWVQKNDLDEDDDYVLYRKGAVAFTINNNAYLATGSNGYSLSTVWEYKPNADEWEEKTGFEGTARVDAVAFTLNNRGFVGLGNNGGSYFDDFWEFKPNEEYDDED